MFIFWRHDIDLDQRFYTLVFFVFVFFFLGGGGGGQFRIQPIHKLDGLISN